MGTYLAVGLAVSAKVSFRHIKDAQSKWPKMLESLYKNECLGRDLYNVTVNEDYALLELREEFLAQIHPLLARLYPMINPNPEAKQRHSDFLKGLDFIPNPEIINFAKNNPADFFQHQENAGSIYISASNESNQAFTLEVDVILLAMEGKILMEYVPSIKINDIEKIDKMKFNRERIAEKLVELLINQIIDNGLVHIDPHPGNVGITENGKIVFYDFGMVLNIDFKIKEKFTSFLIAIYDKDINEICNIAIEIGLITVKPEDIPYFKTFLISFLDYVEKADIEEFKISYINKISKSKKAPFLISSKFVLLLRGISILEGVCKTLDPNFTFKKPLGPYIDQFIVDINYFEKRAISDLKLFTKVPDRVQNSQIKIEVMEKNIRDMEKSAKKERKQKNYQIIGILFTIVMQYEFEQGIIAALLSVISYLILING